MDLDLALTFLEISRSGTLSRAAERLHVTQATVSARLQTLEAELGVQLFTRNRSGAHPTAAGKAFLPFATELMQTWGRASRALELAVSPIVTFSVGGEYSISSAVLLNWLVALRSSRKDVRLRSLVESPNSILDAVQQGELDLGVLYSPLRRTGVRTELVLDEELILVTTRKVDEPFDARDYVYVDWGPDFAADHERVYPGLRDRSSFFGLGPLALRYLTAVGGSGYFRTRAVEPFLREGVLRRVPSAPPFSYSLFAVVSEKADPDMVGWSRGILERTLREPVDGWA